MNPPTPARAIPSRGDIWWAKFPQLETVGSEQGKDRPIVVLSVGPLPVVVITADPINAALPKICIVVPLSSIVEKANRQFRILIPESQKITEPGTGGCPGDSVALTEQTRCISTERLCNQKRVGRLKTEAIASVEAGVRYVLGIP